MEDGRASRQVRQENAARDWALRLSKMPQTIPRSAQQKEDLNSQDRLLLRKIQRDQSKVKRIQGTSTSNSPAHPHFFNF
jgi:hypothetical protein